MSNQSKISGFLEWLPEQQLVEEQFIEIIRTQFERFGFTPIRCRSIEHLDTLLKKGETDKEIYTVVRRGNTGDPENGKWGLHFDLTVPFARFVGERLQSLTFPFRRYQIQTAWRGERPQEGRYREFLQADIDIVQRGPLSLAYDIEVVALLLDILVLLPTPKVTLHLNNRKLLNGFLTGLEIEDVPDALRKMDKLAKVGEARVFEMLREKLSEAQASAIVKFSQIATPDVSFVDEVRKISSPSPLLDEGLSELVAVMEANLERGAGRMIADLSIARGFDYYTGTMCEGFMKGLEHIGAMCSGGRYDNLVSQGAGLKEKYPGVGMSIGVSRMLGVLMGRGHLVASRATPTCVLVALNNPEHVLAANQIASELRSRGIPTEVSGQPLPYGKQMQYAEKKGIPYVWFHNVEGDQVSQVRNLDSKEQVKASADSWTPDPSLLHPRIIYTPPQES